LCGAWKTHLLSLAIVLVANHSLGERGYLCKRHDFVLGRIEGCRCDFLGIRSRIGDCEQKERLEVVVCRKVGRWDATFEL